MHGVYLAYPIDQLDQRMVELFDQVESFKNMVVDYGVAEWVFDPGDAFRVSRAAATDSVAHINRHAHSLADTVVAFLPKGVASIGVPMEIDRAMSQGKNVVVFSDAASYMLNYRNLSRLKRYEQWNTHCLEDAIGWIGQQPTGEPLRSPTYLPFKLEGEEFLPRRTYPTDAGLDLVVSEDTLVGPAAFRDVPCGASVELPDHLWGLVQGRSSTLRKKGLLVNPGVIDAGYRGPLFAGLWNLNDRDVLVKKGERIAQLILMSNMSKHYWPIQVEELADSPRGTNGFGSSGA